MRMIDADALKQHYNVPDAEGVFSYCDTIMRVIDEQPTIEPEVRHGRWIKKRDEFYTAYPMYYAECSECKHTESIGMVERLKYCPNCGADMREEGAGNG